MKNTALARSAFTVSSGTLAGLTGFSKYSDIEAIQTYFVLYCYHRSKANTWIQAWREFWEFNTTI